MAPFSAGPLKGDFLRRAKTRPVEGVERIGAGSFAIRGTAESSAWEPGTDSLARLTPERKREVAVGVAGSTLIEVCGDRPALLLTGL
jgi:hypothetical protein